MTRKFEVNIDDRITTIEEGTTVLDAANKLGIFIPALCHQDSNTSCKSCGISFVQINDSSDSVLACRTFVNGQMTVKTNSKQLKLKSRKIIEEKLEKYCQDCFGCSQISDCKLLSSYFKLCK